MDTVLTEWLSLIIRWLHVVAGIAWIGSSFYFIHLDLSLKSRADQPQGVHGDAWQSGPQVPDRGVTMEAGSAVRDPDASRAVPSGMRTSQG